MKTIVGQFSRIAESRPDACMGDSELETLYRVAKNPAIPAEAILDAHHQAAILRTASHAVVVLVQATSVFNLTKPNRQVKDAGPLESENKFGCFSKRSKVLWVSRSLNTSRWTAI